MDLHIFFFPMLSPGHIIPMVDLARLFSHRPGVHSTIITTPGNVPYIQSSLPTNLTILTIPFPSSVRGLPDGVENVTGLPVPDITPAFHAALNLLRSPFHDLVAQHRPDCIISDLFLPWTSAVAAELGIPRLSLHISSTLGFIVQGTILHFKPHENCTGDDEPFVVPGVPHRIKMTRSQLPDHLVTPEDAVQLHGALGQCLGIIINSFHALELDYVHHLRNVWGMRGWFVGPLSISSLDDSSMHFDSWLAEKKTGSVLYVCFGSLSRLTAAQLREIASGLNATRRPFIWVVRDAPVDDEFDEMANAGGHGLVIHDWAPQRSILNHPAVGGFMTHCGWNSITEGVSAGVPMITWPMFAEQFFNERLVVDVLRIGVKVGVTVWTVKQEEREMVGRETVKRVVEEVMGGGEEAEGRRRRAREMGEEAKVAVKEGGSSYGDISDILKELVAIKSQGKIDGK